MTTYYMHTIGGRPACFSGGQIVYNCRRIKILGHLATSLRQIRSEQRKSIAFRIGMGWGSDNKYDYTLVKIDSVTVKGRK